MTGSERLVGEAFRTLIPQRRAGSSSPRSRRTSTGCSRRSTSPSQVGRKVAIVGRSMRKNLNIARKLGYLDVPERHDRQAAGRRWSCRRDQVMFLCTGSQGEPMSALTRIAYDDHPSVSVERGDTVIISAKPVPGNELRVHDSINRLAKAGAEVLHEEIAHVHVSGHACSGGAPDDARAAAAEGGDADPRRIPDARGPCAAARDAGVPANAIVIAENGSVVQVSRAGSRIVDRVEAGVTFVDGLGVGDVRDVALRDRRRLSEDGVLIIVATLAGSNGGATAPPELIARGFGDSDELLDELRDEAVKVLAELPGRHRRDQAAPGAPARFASAS